MSNWTFCYTSHKRMLFALWFKTLQTDFVVTIYCLVHTSSPDVKVNLLPHKSQQNPVSSMIQNFANWLCSDNLCLVHTFKSRCQIEPFATQVTTESCLLFDSKLYTGFVVTIYVLYIVSSPDVKVNLLPHKSQQNPVRSLIQNYFANWLYWDNS